MMIGEFNSRFTSDGSALFAALREVSRMEPEQLIDDIVKWDEWPPDIIGDGPPPSLRFAARADA
jgi:hypothetical protein